MFQAGMVVQNVKSALRHDDDPLIYRLLNQCYQEMATLTSWQGLRSTVSIDFSNKDSDNMMLLPSDLLGIDYVFDTAENVYQPADRAPALNEHFPFKGKSWFYGSPVSEPTLYLKGLTINKDSNTPAFSGDASAVTLGDYAGDYLSMENVPGYFLIASDGTISPTYRGETLTKNYFQVRPTGTKRMSIVNESGDFVENTVTVNYWKAPEAIFQPVQIIRLPHSRPLELQVMIRALGEHDKKRTQDLQTLFAQAMSQMVNLNHPLAFTGAPVNADGTPFRWFE